MHLRAVLFLVFVMTLFSVHASDKQNFPEKIFSKIQDKTSEYVAIQIWNPFCGPCGEEVQELNKALSATSGKKLSIIGIPIQARKKEIQAFIEHFAPQYEQLSDDDTNSKDFFKTTAVPWTILFSGKERSKSKEWRGKINATELLAEIKRLDILKRGKL